VTTVALCSICHDRGPELQRMLDSVAGQPWDEVIVLDMASSPPITGPGWVRWLRAETNVGPAAGRNRLADAAVSDILLFLDDDARLLSPAYDTIIRLFDADPALGLVAFRIQRADGRVITSEYPFRWAPPDADLRRPCAYFIAAGYACRRDAMTAVGGYDESLFIYGEELDLAFALLSAGWGLEYVPEILVEHLPADAGRTPANDYWPWTMRNRVITVRKFLPLCVAVPHLAVWAVLTMWQAAGAKSLRRWLTATWAALRREVDRRPMDWRSLRRLHRIGGRVFW
jgi:GT2 family glycosyltransferase